MINRVIGDNSTAREPGGGGPARSAFETPIAEVAETARTPASPWGILAGLGAFALTVLISPAVASRTFTPKYAVTLLFAGAGLVPLLVALRTAGPRRRLAIYGAAGFLLVGLVAALTSEAPNIGLLGLYDWGTGWLMWLGCAGAFAIGCRLRGPDGRWLFGGLLAGALANAALALYQTLAVPANSTFGPYQGNQADGFLGNPIFLESLLLGVIALVSVRAAKSDVRSRAFLAWSASLGFMAVALEFSNERAAVGLLAIMFVALVLVYRAKGLLVAVPTAVGYLIGYLGAGRSLGARVAAGTQSVGFHQRLDLWKLALTAIVHRPLIGFGPGELEAAINPRMGLSFARLLQPGKVFTDSHDIVVEVAVTTGVLGLACFLVWVVGAILGARNYFIYFALMCLAVELVEPLNIAVTPLAFLALGAGTTILGDARRESPPLTTPLRAVAAICCAAAVLLGGEMVIGDVALGHTPPAQYSLVSSREANSFLFYWPQSSIAMTDYYRYEAAVFHLRAARRREFELALLYSRETVTRLPMDPLTWVDLGDSELALGRLAAATAEYRRALQTDPWSAAALDGLAQVDMEAHLFHRAAYWYKKELLVLPPGLERTTAQRNLQDARRRIVPRQPAF